MEELLARAAPTLAGFVSGLLATLFAPWVQWGIEKRKLLRASRIQFIEDCREAISEPNDINALTESSIYPRLRPYLSEAVTEHLENPQNIMRIAVYPGGRKVRVGLNAYREKLLDEVAKLEREWKLL